MSKLTQLSMLLLLACCAIGIALDGPSNAGQALVLGFIFVVVSLGAIGIGKKR